MLIQPLLIQDFMQYFNGQISISRALVVGTIICINTVISTILPHPYFYSVMRQGMQVRIAVNGLIYRKVR